ncbi:MAG: hypothetical protein K6D59_01585 [Bacteroidales bacterium]|nr:hypothetical protein [Bacteroidales bacterium]
MTKVLLKTDLHCGTKPRVLLLTQRHTAVRFCILYAEGCVGLQHPYPILPGHNAARLAY